MLCLALMLITTESLEIDVPIYGDYVCNCLCA